MNKFLAALLILVLLFAGSLLNGRYIDALTSRLIARTDAVCALTASGETAAAVATAKEAEALWKKADVYTSVFVRHAEADAVSDALADLRTALYSGDAAAVRGEAEKLRDHLREIARMEHITFGTVF